MKKKLLIKELRSKDNKTLFSELAQAERQIIELRFKASFRKLKNYQEIGAMRKKIAWIWTILSERTIEELDKEKISEVKNAK